MSGSLLNGDGVENDPAAEFLTREQDELAGLGEDLNGMRIEAEKGFDDFDFLTESCSRIPVDAKLEDDPFATGSFQDVPSIFVSAAPPPSGEEDVMNALKNPEGRSQTTSPSPSYGSGREEPEKIRIWREEQKIRLEQKDKDEEVQKGKLREQAKRELEEWYRSHGEQIGKTKACNRVAEKEYQAMTAEVVSGQEWERIAKLCEFNPKLTRASKDTSRMRSIILQLKQNPSYPTTPTKSAAVVS